MKIAVVGAGIVGAAIALRLALQKQDVCLYERTEPGSGTSYGNAGHIGAASIVPWANASNRRNALKWLRDDLHPLRMPMSGIPGKAKWIGRWLSASRDNRAERGTNALADLLRDLNEDLAPLVEASKAGPLISRKGLLHVFADPSAFAVASAGFELRRHHGIRFEELAPEELKEMEPALASKNLRAIFLPDVAQVHDPEGLVKTYVEAFVGMGGKLVREEVAGISQVDADAVELCAKGQERFDWVVLAAGLQSEDLARDLGVSVPLWAERGYHRQFNHGADLLSRSVLFVDSRVVLSPMARGLRLTTGAEFTAHDAPPLHDAMLPIFRAAQAALPEMPDPAEGEPWVGSRPSTPDSLAIIGHAPKADRVILAYGHGHSGITQSAATSRIVANLVRRQAPHLDLAPFSPTRGW